jgi:hypothetical protein
MNVKQLIKSVNLVIGQIEVVYTSETMGVITVDTDHTEEITILIEGSEGWHVCVEDHLEQLDDEYDFYFSEEDIDEELVDVVIKLINGIIDGTPAGVLQDYLEGNANIS